MSDQPNEPIAGYFNDPKQLTRVMGEAVQDAMRTHKLLGHSVVIWRDGKVVVLPPDEIPLREESNGTAQSA